MPRCSYYKPRGVPLSVLEQVELTIDELEAVRLADFEGMYQAQAAERMNVSRQTFGRIVESARRKIADALVNGKAMSIEGGTFRVAPAPGAGGCGGGRRQHRRRQCGHGRTLRPGEISKQDHSGG